MFDMFDTFLAALPFLLAGAVAVALLNIRRIKRGQSTVPWWVQALAVIGIMGTAEALA